MNTAVIGVGSNIEPLKNINEAQDLIREKMEIVKVSRFEDTSPLGGKINQPDFFNGAFLLSTDLDYVELVKTLKKIEDKLGRKRTEDKNAPREIDLDVVAWNGKVIDRDFYRRDFLRRAVLEIAPDIIDET